MNPGSDEALDNGCLCPVLDNGHGKKRDGLFWMNADCPLHGVKPTRPTIRRYTSPDIQKHRIVYEDEK